MKVNPRVVDKEVVVRKSVPDGVIIQLDALELDKIIRIVGSYPSERFSTDLYAELLKVRDAL